MKLLERDAGKGLVGGFIIIWIFSFIASLALSAGLIYVAWHFISKFW